MQTESPRIFADDVEVQEMDICHQASFEAVIEMMDFSDWSSGQRAVDCGGGDGRVSQALLG